MKINKLKFKILLVLFLVGLTSIIFVILQNTLNAFASEYGWSVKTYIYSEKAPITVVKKYEDYDKGTTAYNTFTLNSGEYILFSESSYWDGDYGEGGCDSFESITAPNNYEFATSCWGQVYNVYGNNSDKWDDYFGTPEEIIKRAQNDAWPLGGRELYLHITFQPKINFTGVSSGGKTKNNVSVNWDLDYWKATINGKEYKKNTPITEDGTYTIEWEDTTTWGDLIPPQRSKISHTFTIDKTAPVGTLSGVNSNNRSNGKVSFTWTEANATAKIDGNNYSKNSLLNLSAGSHYFDIFDELGNSRRYSFIVDKTAPVISMYRSDNGSKFSDGALLNCYPYFNVADSDTQSVTISNNSNTYDWKTISTQLVYYDSRPSENVRKYYASRTDLINAIFNKEHTQNVISAKNYNINEAEHIYSSEVDYAYVGCNYSKYYYTANGTNGDYYIFFNDTVRDNFISNNITKYVLSTNKALFCYEGTYTIKATDDVGNYSEKTFTVDLTPPSSGTLSGVVNKGKTNSNVTFSWGADAIRATLNGNPYTKNSTISENGKYVIALFDAADNFTTYTFEIDKIPPTGTLSGVSNGGRTKNNVSFNWIESDATATLNNNNYEKNTPITEPGTYRIVLTDITGNSNTYTFTIDRTAPTGELSGVSNGGRTKNNVKFTWDATAMNKPNVTAKLDNKGYTNGSLITTEGAHTIVLTDDVGNSSTYTFTIDKTPPTGTLSGVENGGRTKNNVSFTWRESTATATLDGAIYNSTLITTEGAHTIVLTDDVGNSSTYTFTIDKTPPTGTLSGVSNGGRTRNNVIFMWAEVGASATLNGSAYNSGNIVSDENNYTVILTDDVGNSSTYTFTIDKTPPTGTLSGVSNGGRTNSDVSFTWTEPGATATLNLAPYERNTVVRAEGEYTIVLTDDVGNSSTYTFTIDKTAPIGNFSENGNLVDAVLYFKNSVSFTCNENDVYSELTVNKNTTPYTFGNLIKADGVYSLKLYDDVGNVNVYNFVIDTIAFTDNFNYLQKNYKSNISAWFETYNFKLSSSNNYIADKYYSFTNYSDCYKYAYNREHAIIESDTYLGGNIIYNLTGQAVTVYDVASLTSYVGQKYYIYKSSENSNTLKAYFNVANLEMALSRYAQMSVTNKYIPDTPAPQFEGDANIPKQNVMRDIIFINTANFTLPYKHNNGYLFLNGKAADYC